MTIEKTLRLALLSMVLGGVTEAQERPRQCEGDRFDLVFQRENTGATAEVFAGVPPGDEVSELRAPVGESHVYVGIVSQNDEREAIGWSLTFEARGDIELRGATTDGTVTVDLFDGGFRKTQIFAPGDYGLERGGVISVVLLSFGEPVALAPGTSTVLEVTIVGERGKLAELAWYQGPSDGDEGEGDGGGGSATPRASSVTFEAGVGARFCQERDLRIRFDDALFARADSNSDGRVNIVDPLHTLLFLFDFDDPPELLCFDASDANDDGALDISDALFSLSFLFLDGAPPPSPTGGACGDDPTADGIGCERFEGCAS